MTVAERYKKVFIESLSIQEKDFSDQMQYNDIPEWDSLDI